MDNFNFRTQVEIKGQQQEIDYSSKIMMLGSCFTTEIGKTFAHYPWHDKLMNLLEDVLGADAKKCLQDFGLISKA